MPALAQPWPAALAGTPAVAVIERAIERQRLSHSLLLHGGDLGTLVGVAHAIADRLLNPLPADSPAGGPEPVERARFPVKDHPDYFALRPKGKTRIIPIGKAGAPEPGTMRAFLPQLYVSPSVAPRKVGIIYEADRMNTESANAFLKTLEEPPAHTTLLLLTTRPYALLPTILSRTLHFRFPSAAAPVATDGWPAWRDDYRAWLGRLTAPGTPDKRAVTGHIFTLYGLTARFAAVLDFATAEEWKQQKEKLPDDLDDAEEEAIQTGIANGLRARLFIEIEQETRAFAHSQTAAAAATGTGNSEQQRVTTRAFTAAIEKLEHNIGLLRLNLNESAALEDFLLASLRLWTKR